MFDVEKIVNEIEFDFESQKIEFASFMTVVLGQRQTYISRVFDDLNIALNYTARCLYQLHLLIGEDSTLPRYQILLDADSKLSPKLSEILLFVDDFLLNEKDINFPNLNLNCWRRDTLPNSAQGLKFSMHIYFSEGLTNPPKLYSDKIFYMNVMK